MNYAEEIRDHAACPDVLDDWSRIVVDMGKAQNRRGHFNPYPDEPRLEVLHGPRSHEPISPLESEEEEEYGYIEEIVEPSSAQPSTSFDATLAKGSVSKSRSSRTGCPPTCVICADPATGYHYEVPTCNGCKTFFRRAVMGLRKFKCKKSESCTNGASKDSRLKCRACRFDRCIEAGMNPYGVQTEPDPVKNELIKSILLKRKVEQADNDVEPSTSPEPANNKLVAQVSSTEDLIDRIIDGLLYVELKAEMFRTSTYTPNSMDPGYDLRKLLAMHSELGKDHPQMQQWSIQTKPLPEPSKEDLYPIEEIVAKRIPFSESLTEIHGFLQGAYGRSGKMWTFMDAVCAIEYMKTFDFYHRIGEKDRVLIAKNIALCCAQLTATYYSYSMKTDVLIYPDGTIPYTGLLKQSKHEFMVKKGVIIPLIELNLDKKEYVLLKAILTCNDTITDISERCRQLLTAERTKYAKLLFQYVMARRGPVHGPAAYAGILAMIDLHFRIIKQRKDFHHIIRIFNLRKNLPVLMNELAED